ncbi:AEC family transporter [Pseudobutyrivibrio sp.]|uniref:AEC family transporter n=1 Tax=Pseudobutyrivibrio sp. TaxID=2014367 RepID=UPI0025FE0391|nr:AEC family transporter [Pseudobutyrivibrio sp.]MBR5649528.1 AEC family transporter [Pseudobutyrivibrio sp.]
MLDNLIFCLNATLPIFLLMVLGYLFKVFKIFNEGLTKGINAFVFKIALPVLVYKELATSEVEALWDGGFIIFCFVATFASILIGWAVAFIFKDKLVRTEFIQGTYRSSAALLGVGIATNLYGSAGMTPLMIIGAVPLYNVAAVILLTTGTNEGKITPALIKKTLIGVITNPIIIGITLGLLRSLIPVSIILPKTLNYVADLATPLGLMALGASFRFDEAIKKVAPTLLATLFKLIIFCGIWIPVAIALGYSHDKLVAVLIMTGSPTTVSSFVMAKSMGYDGTVSAGTVMLTTILSAFTLTLWLYILRTLGLI